ncbi:TPA: type VII secretion protein EssC [Streptococcus agalactiae]|nr:type VII secretion protein EssC [Streptococcus agalactiae]
MLVICYYQSLRYEFNIEEEKSFLISSNGKSPIPVSELENDITLKNMQGQLVYIIDQKEKELTNGVEISGIVFYLANNQKEIYTPLDYEDILIGDKEGYHIRFKEGAPNLLLKKIESNWQLNLFEGDIYLNNHLQKVVQQLPLSLGDEISFQGIIIKLFPDEIQIWGGTDYETSLTKKVMSAYQFYAGYPDFHRSPRIIYRSSEDKITVNAPGNEPNKSKDELLKLIVPPLVMIGVSILISIFRPRGIYIIATMSMALVTMIFSITGYFKNRKQYKQDLQERIDSYHDYLSDKSIELQKLAKEQKRGQHYHYPTIEGLQEMADTYHHRIYEKTPLHFDFLYYRLGLGEVPTSYNIHYSQPERSGKKDPLENEGYNLYFNNRYIKNMPIVANLSHGPVGYIGPRGLVLEQLQLMVNQLAFFHSYHDVQFITIVPEEEMDKWSWMRWLPHATLQDVNVRGFVYNQRSRDQVLNSLNQILKLRRTQREDKSAKEGTLFSPHYVVIVTDEKLILDHVIMEFFTEDPTELGCSLIFVQDVMSSLSENIKTIINIKDRNTGQLVIEEGELKETDFELDHFLEDYDKENISRRLAPLNHLQNLKSSIPEAVTFMEMYQAEEFEDLHVQERWISHAPYKSLAVPLGLRGQDDIVYLNLHEKAHGPHGLVAGTTGSGKSEIIQSYILSLAVNFHPHDVAFLLIDYKGGGMANLFKDLPHLLGTITNLDGAQSMRALVSINAELKRRQRLFAKADVNHINQYQKKYKLGEVSEPMPHLFLISDEFAELKSNQPEFMKELVSTARIGRSLGIHLILATQKPSGVVDDQIWSNSRFKLALKVADRGDSIEMLHTPDAAEITQAGRGLIKRDDIEVLQVALPTEGTETFDIISNIQTESDAMNDKWTGPRPKAIPIVPEELTFDDFMATDSVQADLSANRLPLGLEMVDVESFSLPLTKFKHLLFLSDSDEGLENLGSHLLKTLIKVPEYSTMIIDSLGEHEAYQGQVRTYVGADMISDMAEQLNYELGKRQEQNAFDRWFILIPDFESFVSKTNLSLEQIQNLLDNGPKVGLHLIIGSAFSFVGSKLDPVNKYVKTNSQYVMLGMRLMDQTFLEKVYNSKEARLERDEAYIHDRKNYQKLKLSID